MAIENTDLLVAYRPAEQKHYKIAIQDFSAGSSDIPDGLNVGDILVWDGSEWTATFTADGGVYAS